MAPSTTAAIFGLSAASWKLGGAISCCPLAEFVLDGSQQPFALLEYDRQICDPKAAVDHPIHGSACRGRYGVPMTCAYALPNVPNGGDTRFDGLVKQRRSRLI